MFHCNVIKESSQTSLGFPGGPFIVDLETWCVWHLDLYRQYFMLRELHKQDIFGRLKT